MARLIVNIYAGCASCGLEEAMLTPRERAAAIRVHRMDKKKAAMTKAVDATTKNIQPR